MTWQWVHCDGLLEEPVEKLPSGFGSSPVESERKLVKVIVKMRSPNGSLMSSEQPAFQQRRHTVNQRKKILPNMNVFPNHLVKITKFWQGIVTHPPVSTNFSSGLNTSLHRPPQRITRSIGNSLQADSPDSVAVFLGSNEDQGLPHSPSATFPRFLAANVCLIDFHCAFKSITIRSYHGMTQLVQPHPSGSITSQPQSPLKPKCADARFLVSHIPHSPEPNVQRFSRILKDRAGRHRSLRAAFLAVEQSTGSSPSRGVMTGRAQKTFGPPKCDQVLYAGLFACEPTLKFHDCPRVIFHTREYYILGSLESSAYPHCYKLCRPFYPFLPYRDSSRIYNNHRSRHYCRESVLIIKLPRLIIH